jgi:hypothetical protein
MASSTARSTCRSEYFEFSFHVHPSSMDARRGHAGQGGDIQFLRINYSRSVHATLQLTFLSHFYTAAGGPGVNI